MSALCQAGAEEHHHLHQSQREIPGNPRLHFLGKALNLKQALVAGCSRFPPFPEEMRADGITLPCLVPHFLSTSTSGASACARSVEKPHRPGACPGALPSPAYSSTGKRQPRSLSQPRQGGDALQREWGTASAAPCAPPARPGPALGTHLAAAGAGASFEPGPGRRSGPAEPAGRPAAPRLHRGHRDPLSGGARRVNGMAMEERKLQMFSSLRLCGCLKMRKASIVRVGCFLLRSQKESGIFSWNRSAF